MAEQVPESHRDLLENKVAILATVGKDSRPQLSAVWFLVDGEEFKISLNSSRQKSRNLQRNPGVNLFLIDYSDPRRYVEIRGDAEVSPDPDYEFANRVGAKYGVDLRTRDRPGESRFVVTVKPVRIRAVDQRPK